MTRVFVLLLGALACADAGVVEPPPVAVQPVVRFVGVCDRPAIWFLMRDGVRLGETGLWTFLQSDSLTFPAATGVHRIDWAEVGVGEWVNVLRQGQEPTDSTGAVRVMVHCVEG